MKKIIGSLGGAGIAVIAGLLAASILAYAVLIGGISTVVGGSLGGIFADKNIQQQYCQFGGIIGGADGGPGSGTPVTGTQADYVKAMIGAAKSAGVSRNGMIIATMVMFQESGIRNYANDGANARGYGIDQKWLNLVKLSMKYPHDAVGHDADSIGLYQQRPSAGWAGTPSWALAHPDQAVKNLLDPAFTSAKFFAALKRVKGWESMDMNRAAQRVQGSATPYAYAKWQSKATALVDQYIGTSASAPVGESGESGGEGDDGDTSADDSISATPDAASGLQVRTATWNVFGRNNGKDVRKGMEALIKVADVIGVQELIDSNAVGSAAHNKSSTATFMSKNGFGIVGINSSTPIFYRKSLFQDNPPKGTDLVFDNEHVEYGKDDKSVVGPKYVTWVTLTPKAGGPSITEVNTHLLVDSVEDGHYDKGHPKRAKLWRKQVDTAIKYATAGMAGGGAAQIMMDGNSDFRKDKVLAPRMHAAGLTSQWEALGLDGGDHYIDYVWNSAAAGLKFATMARLPHFGSDHNPIATLSNSTGAAGGGICAGLYGAGGPAGSTGDGADLSGGGTFAAVFAQGKKWIGLPYSFGGGTLNGPSVGRTRPAGFDCSSLVRYMVYNGTGKSITLPRIANAQYAATASHKVAKSDLQPGDLMFWGGSAAGIHHVAMYIGNGNMIEAPHTGAFVRIVPARLSGDYFGATRINLA